MFDQRSKRGTKGSMQIIGKDISESQKIRKRHARKASIQSEDMPGFSGGSLPVVASSEESSSGMSSPASSSSDYTTIPYHEKQNKGSFIFVTL